LGLGHSLSLKLKKTTEVSFRQELFWEKELLGIFVSEHPLKRYEETIKKYVKSIAQLKNNGYGKVVGIIEKIKKNTTHQHQTMLFVEISDSSAQIESIIFPNLYQNTLDIWQEGNIVLISGRISDKEGSLKLIAEKVRLVDEDNLSHLALNGE